MSVSLAEEPTSKSLLAGLHDRDPVAWARVALVYGPAIQAWCRQSRLPEHEVDEVIQRVMLTVITSAAEYRRKHPKRSFRKWLWKVTRHKLVDTYREVYRAQLFDPQQAEAWLVSDGLSLDKPPEDESLIDDTLRRAMEVVRERCNARTWQIFLRAVRGEGTTAVIAADYQTTSDNVRQIKVRCLAKIHDLLELDDSPEGKRDHRLD